MARVDAVVVTTHAEADRGVSCANQCETLVDALRSRGLRLSLFCGHYQPAGREIEVDGADHDIRTVWIPLPRPPHPEDAELSRIFAGGVAAIGRDLALRPGAVHAHDHYSVEAALTLMDQGGAERFVLTLHQAGAAVPSEQPVLRPEVAEAADSILVPAGPLRRQVARTFGVNAKKITEVHYPPPMDPPSIMDRALRRRFARADETLVMFVGCPSPVSGLEFFLSAIASDAGRRRRLRGLVIGGVDEMDEFYRLGSPFDLGNVSFLPGMSTEERRPFYSIADLGVIPSRVAPDAALATELLAAGVAIVYSDVDAHRSSLAEVPKGAARPVSVTGRGANRLIDPALLLRAIVAQGKAAKTMQRRKRAQQMRVFFAQRFSLDELVRVHALAYGREAAP